MEQELRSGDIFECQKGLDRILKTKNGPNDSMANEIGKMLSNFTYDSFIPVEYAEKLLSTVGKIVESSNTDSSSVSRFASCNTFVESLVNMIVETESKFGSTGSKSSKVMSSSFSSHYCYEIGLFILLGFLEKSSLLRTFVQSIARQKLFELMRVVSENILRDHLYLTQVMIVKVLNNKCVLLSK